ncbi:MAG: AmmeMemoRadiSam system protein B [Nanoarchaeota archaeon]|nr:AmmeMemoRadiSam system protein B [Nanoarchaeota archaeon]
MIRGPIVNTQFYAGNFNDLDSQIQEVFKKGPGTTPSNTRRRFMLGAIIPHAGYFFSGKCAAWAYNEIGESRFPETYVIIGTNHTSGQNLVNLDDWETPFGIVKNAGIDLGLKKDPMQHEHSIEVQLPFLQFVSKDKLKELKILPIITTTYNPQLCRKIAEIPGSKVIICSSDFTHYGPNYSYLPFVYSKKENLEKLDKDAIALILSFKIPEFLDYTKNKTICGAAAIANTIKTCQLMGSKKTRLLNYYTSGDITNDYTNTVGYASILFE